MDGYSETMPAELLAPEGCDDPELLKKFEELQTLYSEQNKIDGELKELSKVIDTMPRLPHSVEYWVASFDTNFKLSDFKKMFEIDKQYKTLIAAREKAGQKIKMFMLDNILDQIKTLDNNISDKK